MNVSLTSELEQYISGQVSSGLYPSASDVVREALRALREKDERQCKLAALKTDIDVGLADSQAGRIAPFTEEMAERIKVQGLRRLEAKASTS